MSGEVHLVNNDAVVGVAGFLRAAYLDEQCNVAVFHVNCDESGKLADSTCVVFAACVFPDNEIAPFSDKWRHLLSDAKIRFLHTTDAVRFKGEFKHWKKRNRDRDDLLEAFAKLIMDRAAWLSVAPMDTERFKSLPVGDRKRLKDITYAGFEGLLTELKTDAAKNHRADHRFHLIYDLSDEYSETCLKLFKKMRVMREAYRQFFPSLTFADDTQFPPLQAADLLAYCRREQQAHPADEVSPIIKKLMGIFSSIGMDRSVTSYRPGASLGEATHSTR